MFQTLPLQKLMNMYPQFLLKTFSFPEGLQGPARLVAGLVPGGLWAATSFIYMPSVVSSLIMTPGCLTHLWSTDVQNSQRKVLES